MTLPQQPWQGRRWRAACKGGRVFGLAMMMMWFTGCELMPQRDQPEPVREPSLADEPATVLLAPTMQGIIARLELGQLEQAEAELLQFLDARPGNRLALRFLEQLQRDPVELMGEAHEEITVSPGESLSLIASRELGDGMQFFALARYNDIDVPRRLVPGARLRVPLSLKAEPPLPIEEPVVDPVQQPGEGLARTGRQLQADGRYQQAIALLSAAARGNSLDQAGQAVLAEVAVARARELAETDQLETGLDLLERVSALLGEPAVSQLEPGYDRLQAQADYRLAVEARRSGRLEVALTQFERAIDLDPDLQPAREQAGQVRKLLVMQYHEQALVHYRDQQLAEAIVLWERVLQLDENFEPAQVYLPRARALVARLGELEES